MLLEKGQVYPNRYKGLLYLIVRNDGFAFEGDIDDDDNYHPNGYGEDYIGYQRFRGALSNANQNGLSVSSFEVIERCRNRTCRWQWVLSNGNSGTFHFGDWFLENDYLQRLSDLDFEIEYVVSFRDDLIDLFNVACKEEFIEKDNLIQSNANPDNRYNAFFCIYKSMLPIYSQLNDEEKSHFEVTLGASLFYLPQIVNESWSGYFSKSLLYYSVTDIYEPHRCVKDHIYSRKRAAKDLLNNDFTFEEFCHRYDSIYRKFSYITPTENIHLVNWHEEFDSYEEACASRYIHLINLKQMGIEHNQRNKFIQYCIDRTDVNWNNDNDVFEQQIELAAGEFLSV